MKILSLLGGILLLWVILSYFWSLIFSKKIIYKSRIELDKEKFTKLKEDMRDE